MKLALLRHGLTAWNLEKRVQGQTDIGLAEQGRRQLMALRIPQSYAAFDWYCSPLRRARETADILDLADVTLEPRLIEMNWGEWEGQVLKPLRKKLGDEMRDNESRGLDFRPPGGESPRDVQQRLRAWLEQVAVAGRDSAAVTHKGVIRCIYALASGWDMRGEAPLDFSWNALHMFELDGRGRLLESYREVDLRRARE